MTEHTIYSIAKAGVAMMTKTLAKEMAPAVRVNGVSPGAILWPEQVFDENNQSSILNKIPMQKIGDVSDIARTVAFLVDDAPYVTGQIIAVDGGGRHIPPQQFRDHRRRFPDDNRGVGVDGIPHDD